MGLGVGIGGWLGVTGRLENRRCRAVAWADPGCRWVTPPEVVGAAGGLVLAAVAGRVLLPERWHQVMMGPIIRTVVGGATQVSFGVRLRFPK